MHTLEDLRDIREFDLMKLEANREPSVEEGERIGCKILNLKSREIQTYSCYKCERPDGCPYASEATDEVHK